MNHQPSRPTTGSPEALLRQENDALRREIEKLREQLLRSGVQTRP